ncbi:MAG: DMT family transporter [Clostridia bacterium]|nr:DMT family transporter [Clostridia bacterium]MDD4798168.1 DMT family transporter [Clostridia bacterium]
MNKIKLPLGSAAAIAALVWSINSVIVKTASVDSFTLVSLRSLIAGLLLLPFIKRGGITWNKNIILMIVCYGFYNLSIVMSYRLTTAIVVAGLTYTAAAWLFIINAFCSKKFNFFLFIPQIFLLLGVTVFILEPTETAAHPYGNLFAVTTGIGLALTTWFTAKVGAYNPLGVTAIANLGAFPLIFLFIPDKAALLTMTASDIGTIIYMALFPVTLCFGLYNYELTRLPGQKVAMICLLELVFAPIFCFLFLREIPTAYGFIGWVSVFFGLVLDAKINPVGKLSPQELKTN